MRLVRSPRPPSGQQGRIAAPIADGPGETNRHPGMTVRRSGRQGKPYGDGGRVSDSGLTGRRLCDTLEK